MKKIVLSIALLLALLISGCDQLEESSISTPMSVNIEGYIYDGVTEVPIEGAIISGKFGSTKTDKKGFYAINGLNMGTYKFIIEVDEYMVKVITSTIVEKEEDFKGDNLNELIQTYMYKADQAISTQLIDDLGTVLKPQANIPYTIILNSTYKNRFIYGVTDADGMINDTVPNDDFTILVDTVIDDVQYSVNQYLNSPSSLGKQYDVTMTDLNITPLFVLSTNVVDADGNAVQEFDPSINIEVEFNQALNIDESHIALEKYVNGNYYDVKVDISFDNGNKNVVLSPYNGDLAQGQQYRLSIYKAVANSNEKAVHTSYLDFVTRSSVIITSLRMPAVFQLKSPSVIQENTTSISAQLTVDANSDYVEVYGRYVNSEEFVVFHVQSCNWTDQLNGIIMIDNIRLSNLPGIEIPNDGIFSGGNDFELMIRSYTYSNGELVQSEFSNVVTLYKDMAKVN